MAQRRRRRARADGRRRQRAALVAMALFPLLVGIGFFAPGWVRMLATAQEAELGPRGPIADRIGPFAHRPLPAPREFLAASSPDLLDLDRIFAGDAAPIAPDAAERLNSFPRGHGDSIVLDDLGSFVDEIDFKDALIDDLQSVGKSDSGDEGVLPMCGTLPFGNCVRFDDFTGARKLTDDTPVPEPGSAALLLLGLGWLGRRRSRAGTRAYCQPITS